MIILRDLFEVVWDITELKVTAYSPEPKLLHEWIFGENIYETIHMWHDRKKGLLTIVDEKINSHGEPGRGGGPEIGWGVKEKLFPKELLDSKVTHLWLRSRGNWEGQRLCVEVEMQELTAEILKKIIIGTRGEVTDECTKESSEGAGERTNQTD